MCLRNSVTEQPKSNGSISIASERDIWLFLRRYGKGGLFFYQMYEDETPGEAMARRLL
jgi:hypothetical protein